MEITLLISLKLNILNTLGGYGLSNNNFVGGNSVPQHN